MDFHVWLAFFLGTLVICGSPGPNMLQVMATSARYGFRESLKAMMGCFIPVFLYICISLAGLGVFLKTFPSLFDILRYGGAAYLIYLGIQAWRTIEETNVNHVATIAQKPDKLFKRSLMVGIANPKAILFAIAYFPQFVSAEHSAAVQFTILLATFSVLEFSWYMVYALGGKTLTHLLQKAVIRQWFNRLTGSVFAGFGILMVAQKS